MKKLLCLLVMLLIAIVSYCPTPGKFQLKRIQEIVIKKLERDEYERQFNLFAKHLGFRESGNRSHVINPIGCMGEFQFHPATLKRLGYGHITPEKFREDPMVFPPELQRKCLEKLIEINSMDLRRYEKYIGKKIKEIVITRAGLLAGMHLGGLGSVQKFLATNGASDSYDMNGTHVGDYIKEFSNYRL